MFRFPERMDTPTPVQTAVIVKIIVRREDEETELYIDKRLGTPG